MVLDVATQPSKSVKDRVSQGQRFYLGKNWKLDMDSYFYDYQGQANVIKDVNAVIAKYAGLKVGRGPVQTRVSTKCSIRYS